MAKLTIVKEGDDTLRKVCRPVTEITPKIERLLDDMLQTMHDAEGVGLAAPQVGILRRIAIVETEDGAVPVEATLGGILRGLIRDGYPVKAGFKMADIDPRADEYDNCFTVSDKARCIAGGVLEAILQLRGERGL